VAEVIRYLRTDPIGLAGAYWHARLIVDLLWSEAKERTR
jgi:hypothetical protein